MLKKVNLVQVANIIFAIFLSFAPLAVGHAASGLDRGFGCPTGLNCHVPSDANAFIRLIINWILGITFGLAVLMLIIGGFWYVTSGGSQDLAEKGKKTVINALIGIIIIILSYVIVNVVANFVSSGNANQ